MDFDLIHNVLFNNILKSKADTMKCQHMPILGDR